MRTRIFIITHSVEHKYIPVVRTCPPCLYTPIRCASRDFLWFGSCCNKFYYVNIIKFFLHIYIVLWFHKRTWSLTSNLFGVIILL